MLAYDVSWLVQAHGTFFHSSLGKPLTFFQSLSLLPAIVLEVDAMKLETMLLLWSSPPD